MSEIEAAARKVVRTLNEHGYLPEAPHQQTLGPAKYEDISPGVCRVVVTCDRDSRSRLGLAPTTVKVTFVVGIAEVEFLDQHFPREDLHSLAEAIGRFVEAYIPTLNG